MFQEFLRFLAPPTCLGCEEPLESGDVYCEECLKVLVLLDPSRRCFRCFHQFMQTECSVCARVPVIYRRAAVFEKERLLEPLLRDKKKEKLVAALFSWQYTRLQWPMFDCIASDASLISIRNILAKQWKVPIHKKHRLYENCAMLFLSESFLKAKFSFSVMTAKVFHLAFFL